MIFMYILLTKCVLSVLSVSTVRLRELGLLSIFDLSGKHCILNFKPLEKNTFLKSYNSSVE